MALPDIALAAASDIVMEPVDVVQGLGRTCSADGPVAPLVAASQGKASGAVVLSALFLGVCLGRAQPPAVVCPGLSHTLLEPDAIASADQRILWLAETLRIRECSS